MNAAEPLMTGQYLTFALAGDVFAFDVSLTREVLDLGPVTRVPQVPDYMLGVINLRGSAVPVVDMRRKFGLAQGDKTRDTCIIVVEIKLDGEPVMIGALVDAVLEVKDMDTGQIEPPPRLGTRLKSEYIGGMGIQDGGFVILLDVAKVFAAAELPLHREPGDQGDA